MSETLSIDFNKAMPLFPLADCVLLPHVALPLHIFEPRYRQMTGEALDSNGLIAMAVFDGPVNEKEYADGHPPIRPNVCLGYIVQYQGLSDGRYVLLLQGVCRARIIEEVAHEPYRLAKLEPLDVEPPGDEALAPVREQLEALIGEAKFDDRPGITELREVLERAVPTVALIDLAIMTWCTGTEERYVMLAEDEAAARGRWIVDRMTRSLKEENEN
ncbi:MAG: hypothetical protein GC162_19315 [Planctomycetes bacterium]|nr:hypothetical protein [Planctomycetota bacterium]